MIHIFSKEGNYMENIKFYTQENIPLEMHRARIVQKINLIPIEERLKRITEAGNNTFLLYNQDIYLDLLTDSGVNAMSDEMQAAMLVADDSYAGSKTYLKMADKLKELFKMEYFLPAHQGRACENILITCFVKPGNVVPMNIRFDSIKDFIARAGATFVEVMSDEAVVVNSDNLFKGNFDLEKLRSVIEKETNENIPFVRIEAGSNLIGGQPISLENIREVSKICKDNDILVVLDASLLQDNLYFIKQREEQCKNMSIREITKEIADTVDIIYFSGRKLGFARGGGICIRDRKIFLLMQRYIPMFEGFVTYGGMSVKEMEALTVGLEETMDENVISQGPIFIEFMAKELEKYKIPIIKPAGGLGVHIDAKAFLPHVKMEEYPAGALAVALYICSGVRCMERGTISEQPNEDGSENFPQLELVRIALPRRVYSLSHIKYTIDRLKWLYDNRELIEGLRFTEQPEALRFYFGRLEPVSNWQNRLVSKFREDFGDSL